MRAGVFLWKGFCLMIFWEDFLVSWWNWLVYWISLCTELKNFGFLAKGCLLDWFVY